MSRRSIPPPSGVEVKIRVRYRVDVSKTRATFETTTIHLATFETTMTTTTATTRDGHRSCSGMTAHRSGGWHHQSAYVSV